MRFLAVAALLFFGSQAANAPKRLKLKDSNPKFTPEKGERICKEFTTPGGTTGQKVLLTETDERGEYHHYHIEFDRDNTEHEDAFNNINSNARKYAKKKRNIDRDDEARKATGDPTGELAKETLAAKARKKKAQR